MLCQSYCAEGVEKNSRPKVMEKAKKTSHRRIPGAADQKFVKKKGNPCVREESC